MALPVFDTARILVGGIKLTLLIGFTVYFFGFAETAIKILTDFISPAFNLLDLSSINLGCVSSKLGLTDFMNSLVSQLYVVSTLVIASIGSLLTTKFILLFFSFLMRV